MGLLDRVLGRKADFIPEPVAAGVPRADALAVDRYERALRAAPTDVIERAHLEAFEKLTPAQLDLVFERFTADAATEADRPADARPASLARSAVKAEARQPGAIARVLGTDAATANIWVGSAILDTVIWYSIASTALGSWASHDDGSAGAGSDVGADVGSDAAGDSFGFGDFGF